MSKYPMGQIHTELVFSIFLGNRSNLGLCSFSYQKYYDTLSISKHNVFLKLHVANFTYMYMDNIK